MHILSISNDPHDPGSGSGYVITGYTKGLGDRGHTVDAYGPEDWRTLNVHRGRRYLYPVLMAIFGLRAFSKRSETYDLVEVWGGASWLLAVLLRRFWPNVRLVHHSNGIEQHRVAVERKSGLATVRNTWFQADLSFVYDWGLQAADAVITVGPYDVPFLKENSNLPDERVYAIDNPLPESFINQNVEVAKRPNRLGFCGSWIPRKGLGLMKKDIASFLEPRPSWTFSVVGGKGAQVKSEFPKEVRGQIEVIPYLDRDALVEWYHSLSVFVLASVYESFGMVNAEAMACGTPVVTTNVGFARGLTHNEEAFIIPKPQSPHLFEALTTVANNETLRQKLAENGYSRVQELTWTHAVDRLESIYQKLVHDQ